MWSYLLRCCLQKKKNAFIDFGVVYRKKKTNKKKTTFFGVVTLNTHIFLFGPTKHAKHFEKNGWTDLCRINPILTIYVIKKCSYLCSA